MNKNFCFHKKDELTFEIKEESLKELGMPIIAKEPMGIIDDTQMGYDDPRWIEKSKLIKARDNYTCQLCHTFNPMQEGMVYVQQGEYETYHQYYAGNSNYKIHVKDYSITINIDFLSDFHLSMPRLNVHHKIYYRNRNIWDYQDDDLVTLCENCHHYIHSLNDIGIPIVEKNSVGQTILIGKTRPKPYQAQIDHTDLGTFHPLSIVKENRWGNDLKGKDKADYNRAKVENKKWYDYQDILNSYVAHITHFKCYDPRWNKYTHDEIKKVADFVIMDFIENILGFKKVNNK